MRHLAVSANHERLRRNGDTFSYAVNQTVPTHRCDLSQFEAAFGWTSRTELRSQLSAFGAIDRRTFGLKLHCFGVKHRMQLSMSVASTVVRIAMLQLNLIKR